MLAARETALKHKTVVVCGALMLALGLAGCGGGDSQPTTLAPTPTPPALSPFPGATLRNVGVSGVVYELTATGRVPIPRAYVYCEVCSAETHMFNIADDNGFYQFSGDVASGGGVWVTPGIPTGIYVGTSYNPHFRDPPRFAPPRRGAGWREVLIDGDTRFDIELYDADKRGSGRHSRKNSAGCSHKTFLAAVPTDPLPYRSVT